MSSNVIAVDLTLAWPLLWADGPETKKKNNVKGLGTISSERCITFIDLVQSFSFKTEKIVSPCLAHWA